MYLITSLLLTGGYTLLWVIFYPYSLYLSIATLCVWEYRISYKSNTTQPPFFCIFVTFKTMLYCAMRCGYLIVLVPYFLPLLTLWKKQRYKFRSIVLLTKCTIIWQHSSKAKLIISRKQVEQNNQIFFCKMTYNFKHVSKYWKIRKMNNETCIHIAIRCYDKAFST